MDNPNQTVLIKLNTAIEQLDQALLTNPSFTVVKWISDARWNVLKAIDKQCEIMGIKK